MLYGATCSGEVSISKRRNRLLGGSPRQQARSHRMFKAFTPAALPTNEFAPRSAKDLIEHII
jgi:hypothetical protein